MSLRCDWSSCKGLHFDTKESVADHQADHYARLIDSVKFEAVYRCGWHDCNTRKSAKTFRNFDALKKHLKGHVKTQWCAYANCNLAFARKSDLARHVQTKHSDDRKYRCPISSCDHSITGFTRKDKLDEHTRKDHDNVQCTLDHCGARVLLLEMNDHLNRFHGGNASEGTDDIYECAFRGCESTTSRFICSLAERHLKKDHHLWDASGYVLQGARESGPVASRGNAFVMGHTSVFTRAYRARCKTCTINELS
jgi:hypothetical protein